MPGDDFQPTLIITVVSGPTMVLDKLLTVFDLYNMEIEIPMLEKVIEKKLQPVDP